MKARVYLLITLAAVLLMGVPASLVRSAERTPGEPGASTPVIGQLLLRKYRVMFRAGGRFDVHTRDGKLVAQDTTMAKLKAIDPALHEALVPIVAGKAFVHAGSR